MISLFNKNLPGIFFKTNVKCLLIAQSNFLKIRYEKANIFLLCTMPSVSERGDMDLVKHSVVIRKIESHSVKLTVLIKEN